MTAFLEARQLEADRWVVLPPGDQFAGKADKVRSVVSTSNIAVRVELAGAGVRFWTPRRLIEVADGRLIDNPR